MNMFLGVVAVPPPYGTRPIVIAFIIFCVFILILANILRLVLSPKKREYKSFRGEIVGNTVVGAFLLGLSVFFVSVDRNPDSPASTIGMFILFVVLVVPVAVIKFKQRHKRKKRK